MPSTALPQVLTIAADIFGGPPGRISAESSPETLENWDSIQHLNFVLALEERFGLQLSPEEIDSLRSVGDAAAIVERRTGG